MYIKWHKLNPKAKIPTKRDEEAGFDIYTLEDIIKSLNTQEFMRIKVGISNNKNIDTKDYVLGKFSNEDLQTYDNIFKISVDIINDFIKSDFDKVMSKYNHK